MTEARGRMARRFRGQASSCAELGSPAYSDLLARCADDIDDGGPIWEVLGTIADLPGGALAPLRFMGATHRLALAGRAPALAACYPSCGGTFETTAAWAAVLDLAKAAADELVPLLHRGVQTNEVGRCAALLRGFLDVAAGTGLPLRLLEIGASAGLNLRWDRYRYGVAWGGDSPVEIGAPWDSPKALSPRTVDVVERAGCDLHPIDPTSEDGRLTLLSYVWPDMERRFAPLDAACRLAASQPVELDPAPADAWVTARLATPVAGAATVVFHSVVLQYLEPAARARFVESVRAAGSAATEDAPLAWLRLEPAGALGPPEFELRLTTWPGGDDHVLAVAHPHGYWVRWAE